MGLRCSLLGHDFGETTTERNREEQGGEVVVVERELEICARCGTEKIVSENTEVRTIAASPDEDDADAGVADAEADVAETPQVEAADAVDEAPVEDAPVAESDPVVEADSDAGVTPTEHAAAPEDDDAVILEDDPEQERDREQWPDEAEAEEDLPDPAAESEPSPWPEQEGEDEGFDAKPNSGDDSGSVDFSGGLTPEVTDPGEADEEGYVEAPDDGDAGTVDSFKKSGNPPPGRSTDEAPSRGGDDDVGFTSAGPVKPPSGSTSDADTVLVCPECGFERPATRASLRAGDICPDCRRGYLAEQR